MRGSCVTIEITPKVITKIRESHCNPSTFWRCIFCQGRLRRPCRKTNAGGEVQVLREQPYCQKQGR